MSRLLAHAEQHARQQALPAATLLYQSMVVAKSSFQIWMSTM